MRLTSIKLAGFKSFVDPTTVLFRSNLTAVVGPNGCGKSNVIDAVRWVMGEGSAKTLRASAMTDVIFNGSTQRQPVGKAAIELVFDNSDGSLQGEYAAFSEISVRREVTRDAQSFYYLNGTRCRRRDITDLFLGTGLGPRSYAIIEQGMINRFIEAKPDELRSYIEEAAGVSRYKERRRETETRLKRTRENLDRLGDLEEELRRQLQHLKRQAEAAKRFKTLSEDIRQAEIRLAVRRWNNAQSKIDQAAQRIQTQEQAIQDALVHRESIQGQMQAQRQQFDDTQHALEKAQADFYSAGAEVTRLEQQQKGWRDQLRTLEQNEARVKARLQSAHQVLSQDQGELEAQQQQCKAWQSELDALSTQEAPLKAEVENTEHAWRAAREAQQRDADARAQLQQSVRLAERDVLAARKALEQIQARRQRLMAGRPAQPEIDRIDVAELDQKLALDLADFEAAQVALAEATDQREQALQARQAAQREVDQAQSQWDTITQALSQTAEEDSLDLPRVLDGISIPPEHAEALSSALGPLAQAYQIESVNQAGQAGQYVFSPVDSWEHLMAMTGARLAESVQWALERQDTLQAGEFFVTPQGQQIGRAWLVLSPQFDPRPQLLAQRDQVSTRLDQAQRALAALESNELLEVEGPATRVKEAQQQVNDSQRALDRAQADQAANQRLLDDYQRAVERYESDLAALEDDSEQAHLTLESAQEALEEAEQAWSSAPDVADDARALEAAWHDARDALEDHQISLRSLTLKLQTARARMESLEERVTRARDDVEEAAESLAELEIQREDLIEPEDLQGQLNESVARRLAAEQSLAAAREAMQGFDTQVRALESERAQTESQLERMREALAEARTQVSTEQALQSAQTEYLAQQSADPVQWIESLGDQTETQLAIALERLEKQRERSGAVNLAAVEELEEAQQRQAYYEAQRSDLEQALETLEGAIRKIDKETRALFRETFDRINLSLQGLFPKVFGGGEAWLELTDTDPLEAGVSLMARPPGKKNSTIHLLSGGEKALTAVALVFAIFQLNPAPFCMLDEVDAPLDDANVGRYANLLQEMSDQVQFIFVTHNKIAMEKAEHLMGVTMHEPGVSRLVSVDVAEAVAMTEQT